MPSYGGNAMHIPNGKTIIGGAIFLTTDRPKFLLLKIKPIVVKIISNLKKFISNIF